MNRLKLKTHIAWKMTEGLDFPRRKILTHRNLLPGSRDFLKGHYEPNEYIFLGLILSNMTSTFFPFVGI